MITVNLDVFLGIFGFVMFYYLTMFLVSFRDKRSHYYGSKLDAHRAIDDGELAYVIMVPCHNEERVIGGTLQNMCKLPGRRKIIVIDDGSTDATASCIEPFIDDTVHIYQRTYPDAKRGKGKALNAAYGYITEHLQEWFPDLLNEQILIAVTDADVRISPDVIYQVASEFVTDPTMGAVQAPVAIYGADKHIMLMMQDIEFMSYFYVIQKARHWISSVAMGGNGQFIRYSSMKLLGSSPWSKVLTEDIDIGMQLIAHDQKIGFTARDPVVQQGLTSFRKLLKQRTRWVQGHYQVWGRLPSVWKSDVSLLTKLDTSLYMMMILMPFVLFTDYAVAILAYTGHVEYYSNWLYELGTVSTWLPAAIQLVVSFAIQLILLPTYFRVTRISAPWYSWIGIGIVFAVYAAFIWIVASFRAVTRIFFGKNNWNKTEREIVVVTEDMGA